MKLCEDQGGKIYRDRRCNNVLHNSRMNSLNCQSCGSALQADGFDRRLAVVHCSHCGVLFDLTKPRVAADEINSENNSTPRPQAAMPHGIKAFKNGRQFTLVRTWRDSTTLPSVVFSLLFTLVILFQINVGRLNPVHAIFVVVVVGMIYRSLASLFNKTTITVDENNLTVRHSPLPWHPKPTIAASSIEQLYVSEGYSKYSKSKNDIKTPYYILNAVLRDNSSKQLSSKMPLLEQAVYLEQEFETALHIRDRRVAGEIKSSTQDI